jgi:hypothetical protein
MKPTGLSTHCTAARKKILDAVTADLHFGSPKNTARSAGDNLVQAIEHLNEEVRRNQANQAFHMVVNTFDSCRSTQGVYCIEYFRFIWKLITETADEPFADEFCSLHAPLEDIFGEDGPPPNYHLFESQDTTNLHRINLLIKTPADVKVFLDCHKDTSCINIGAKALAQQLKLAACYITGFIAMENYQGPIFKPEVTTQLAEQESRHFGQSRAVLENYYKESGKTLPSMSGVITPTEFCLTEFLLNPVTMMDHLQSFCTKFSKNQTFQQRLTSWATLSSTKPSSWATSIRRSQGATHSQF